MGNMLLLRKWNYLELVFELQGLGSSYVIGPRLKEDSFKDILKWLRPFPLSFVSYIVMENLFYFLKVLYPSSQPLRSFHGDVTYCNLKEENVATPGGLSLCSFNCPCVGPQCAEVFLFMATSNSLRNWTICEISASNWIHYFEFCFVMYMYVKRVVWLYV